MSRQYMGKLLRTVEASRGARYAPAGRRKTLDPQCPRCRAPMRIDRGEWWCLACGPQAEPRGLVPLDPRDPFDQLIGESEKLARWLEMRIERIKARAKPGKRTAENGPLRDELALRKLQLRKVNHCIAELKRPKRQSPLFRKAKGRPIDGDRFYCTLCGHHRASKEHRACIAARKQKAS